MAFSFPDRRFFFLSDLESVFIRITAQLNKVFKLCKEETGSIVESLFSTLATKATVSPFLSLIGKSSVVTLF